MRTRSSSCESDDATSGNVLALQRVWSAADCLQLLCVLVVSVCVCVCFVRSLRLFFVFVSPFNFEFTREQVLEFPRSSAWLGGVATTISFVQ
jgi:hypothetical protein